MVVFKHQMLRCSSWTLLLRAGCPRLSCPSRFLNRVCFLPFLSLLPQSRSSLERLSHDSPRRSFSTSPCGSDRSRSPSSSSLLPSSFRFSRGLTLSMSEGLAESANSVTCTEAAPSLITKWLRYSSAILRGSKVSPPGNAPQTGSRRTRRDERFSSASDSSSSSRSRFSRDRSTDSAPDPDRQNFDEKRQRCDLGSFFPRMLVHGLTGFKLLGENSRERKRTGSLRSLLPTSTAEDDDADAESFSSGSTVEGHKRTATLYDPFSEDPEEVVRRIKVRLGIPLSPRPPDRRESTWLSIGEEARREERRRRHEERFAKLCPDSVQDGNIVSTLEVSTATKTAFSTNKCKGFSRRLSHAERLPSSLSLSQSTSSVCLSPSPGQAVKNSRAEAAKRPTSQQGHVATDDVAEKVVLPSPAFSLSERWLATNCRAHHRQRLTLSLSPFRLSRYRREVQPESTGGDAQPCSSQTDAAMSVELKGDVSPRVEPGLFSAPGEVKEACDPLEGNRISKSGILGADRGRSRRESPLQFLSSFVSEEGPLNSREKPGTEGLPCVTQDRWSIARDYGRSIHTRHAESRCAASLSTSPVLLSDAIREQSNSKGGAGSRIEKTEQDGISVYKKLENESQGPLSMSELLCSSPEPLSQPERRTEKTARRLEGVVNGSSENLEGGTSELPHGLLIPHTAHLAKKEPLDASDGSSGTPVKDVSCVEAASEERKGSHAGISSPFNAKLHPGAPPNDGVARSEGTGEWLESEERGDICKAARRGTLACGSTSQNCGSRGQAKAGGEKAGEVSVVLPVRMGESPTGERTFVSFFTASMGVPAAARQHHMNERQAVHHAALSNSFTRPGAKLTPTIESSTSADVVPLSEGPESTDVTGCSKGQATNEGLTISAQLEEIQQLQVLLADEEEVDLRERSAEKSRRCSPVSEPAEKERGSLRLGDPNHDHSEGNEGGLDLGKSGDSSCYTTLSKHNIFTISDAHRGEGQTIKVKMRESPPLEELRSSERPADISSTLDESILLRHQENVKLVEVRTAASRSGPRTGVSLQLEVSSAGNSRVFPERGIGEEASTCSPRRLATMPAARPPKECLEERVVKEKADHAQLSEAARFGPSPSTKRSAQNEDAIDATAEVGTLRKVAVEECLLQQCAMEGAHPDSCETPGEVTLLNKTNQEKECLSAGDSRHGEPSSAAVLAAQQTKSSAPGKARFETEGAAAVITSGGTSRSCYKTSGARLFSPPCSPPAVVGLSPQSRGYSGDPACLLRTTHAATVASLNKNVAPTTGASPALDSQSKGRFSDPSGYVENIERRTGWERNAAEDRDRWGNLSDRAEASEVNHGSEHRMAGRTVAALVKQQTLQQGTFGGYAVLPSVREQQAGCLLQKHPECFCVSSDLSSWLRLPPVFSSFSTCPGARESSETEEVSRAGAQGPSFKNTGEPAWLRIRTTPTAVLQGADAEQPALLGLFLPLQQVEEQQGRRPCESPASLLAVAAPVRHLDLTEESEPASTLLHRKVAQGGSSAGGQGWRSLHQLAISAASLVEQIAVPRQHRLHQQQPLSSKGETSDQEVQSSHPEKQESAGRKPFFLPVSRSEERKDSVSSRETLFPGATRAEEEALRDGHENLCVGQGVARLYHQATEETGRRDLLWGRSSQAYDPCLNMGMPKETEATEVGPRSRKNGVPLGIRGDLKDDKVQSLSGGFLGVRVQAAEEIVREPTREERELSATVGQPPPFRREPTSEIRFFTHEGAERTQEKTAMGTPPDSVLERIEEQLLVRGDEGRKDSERYFFFDRPDRGREPEERVWREWGEEAYLDQKYQLYAAIAQELGGGNREATEGTASYSTTVELSVSSHYEYALPGVRW
ncbi:hypothetical protein CSUI_003841 [Cystoisospora suis]|uniref:Uncharacterized protein n=1 Tax=Cystoisospora suis TaxID=483139 RepID=A0A2C6KE70_9APIC|nr:hypothetical protein CSUI_003841 [Cystoisospora suis]